MLATLKPRKPAWTLARRRACLRFGVRPNAFGNALGDSIVGQMRSAGAQEERLAAQSQALYGLGATGQGGGYGLGGAGAAQGFGRSVDNGIADRVWQMQEADAYDRGDYVPGGGTVDAELPGMGGGGDKLRLSNVVSASDADYYDKIIAQRQMQDAQQQAASANYRATQAQATSDLYARGAGDVRDTSPESELITAAESSPLAGTGLSLPGNDSGLGLSTRFVQGAFHGAVDMVYQPLAQVVDLGQALYGLTTGGAYEPHWFSGIGQNYAGGMGYGETIVRSLTGIPVAGQVLGVGLSSYDLTSSALRSDWGGVAEGLGGMAGGFGVVKYGQRYFAPEPGAELGIYRARPQVDIADPWGLAPTLPGQEAANFTRASPVDLAGRNLNRIFETYDLAARPAKPNGGYWSEQVYSNEQSWRTGAAVPERQNWNNGMHQGDWMPSGGYGWGGPAAPQGLGQPYSYSNTKLGFTAGWIQRGGDYQIWTPPTNRPSVDVPGGVITGPSPWSKA